MQFTLVLTVKALGEEDTKKRAFSLAEQLPGVGYMAGMSQWARRGGEQYVSKRKSYVQIQCTLHPTRAHGWGDEYLLTIIALLYVSNI
jgi:hypothetical protein